MIGMIGLIVLKDGLRRSWCRGHWALFISFVHASYYYTEYHKKPDNTCPVTSSNTSNRRADWRSWSYPRTQKKSGRVKVTLRHCQGPKFVFCRCLYVYIYCFCGVPQLWLELDDAEMQMQMQMQENTSIASLCCSLLCGWLGWEDTRWDNPILDWCCISNITMYY